MSKISIKRANCVCNVFLGYVQVGHTKQARISLGCALREKLQMISGPDDIITEDMVGVVGTGLPHEVVSRQRENSKPFTLFRFFTIFTEAKKGRFSHPASNRV